MHSITMKRHEDLLVPNIERVLMRPFLPPVPLIISILDRVLAIDEVAVARELDLMLADFDSRHLDMEAPLLLHYNNVACHIAPERAPSHARKLLIGAYFSGEYALESAALFNPSIVAHPDQNDVPRGSLRFAMSLRATGEGHVSSIEFRSGLISASGGITLDPLTRFIVAPEVNQNPRYEKESFIAKLREMDCENQISNQVMRPLGDSFTLDDLKDSLSQVMESAKRLTQGLTSTLTIIQWLADSNYEIHFAPSLAMSERVIFPFSDNESNGIEDARFVRFVDDDASVTYYATYTAYNGHAVLPQLIETVDFVNFRVRTLNGSAVQNKGMALFPRRIDGRYAMLSRQDDENILIMFSDNPHFWHDPEVLMRPVEAWESVKIGNCGSPIETEAGWLVITHGVGPMRKYCIGAALLDLDDPSIVLGRLRTPLLEPTGIGREGYVPNVVYSCGSLIHGGELILPYAMSDRATAFATIPVDKLLSALLS
ncbi:MAG: glycoside hydrolase family 130 protein [Planctomycetota bacterium]|jgi:predicted GH43/DUF377 family glycosyl hydrolase|nr:glycoside hydrolase family 130 protein [Planctomycetota bacterium]